MTIAPAPTPTKTKKVTRTTPSRKPTKGAKRGRKFNPDLTPNSINIRITPAQTAALTALYGQFADICKTSIIRQALTIGLDALLSRLGIETPPQTDTDKAPNNQGTETSAA